MIDSIVGFQGFLQDDGSLLERILLSGEASFIERARAEEDPSFKQLIPYVVMIWEKSLLYYVRGKESGEDRLRSLGSVGIGGHIAVTDRTFFDKDVREIFLSGMRREVAEEVEVRADYRERILGFINDDSNAVGQVHLGVLAAWELVEPEVFKKERSITSLEFLRMDELIGRKLGMETWSQIVIDNFHRIFQKK